ncbi:MAG: sulfate adenylyltransferase subunit CysN [Candidatus Azobacteroides sp.]|nr:sulfate adenylyltransferase subunit CysN [Candidatus Azobacteroides sp.]
MMNTDIQSFLDQDQKKDLLRFLTAGSVDDGKSTLIGRLLYDSKKIYEDHLSALVRDSQRIGKAGEMIDYALLLDGLKAEREQGITIDVAYRYFSTNNRKFIIADTPGHEQYTRNMVTGGSTANLAIILVDAGKGISLQTRRHTFIASLLGIRKIVLAVNKMDLAGYRSAVFNTIVMEYKAFAGSLNFSEICCIPISALYGDNVVEQSSEMPWYTGKTLMEYLESVAVEKEYNTEDLRFPVQYVIRHEHNYRGFCGKILSGIVRTGDEIIALPAGIPSLIKRVEIYGQECKKTYPNQCATLMLEDEIDISRGEMIVGKNNPPVVSNRFSATMVWMDEQAMDRNKSYLLKHTTNLTRAKIDDVAYRIDINSMEKNAAVSLTMNEIGNVSITTGRPLMFDCYSRNRLSGAFILIDPVSNNTSAAGMITEGLSEDAGGLRISDAVLNLSELNIGEENYEVVDILCRELAKQGINVLTIKEKYE